MRIKVRNSPTKGGMLWVFAVDDKDFANYTEYDTDTEHVLAVDDKDAENYTFIREKELSGATLVKEFCGEISNWYKGQQYRIIITVQEYEVKGHIRSTESLYNGKRYTFLTIVQ